MSNWKITEYPTNMKDKAAKKAILDTESFLKSIIGKWEDGVTPIPYYFNGMLQVIFLFICHNCKYDTSELTKIVKFSLNATIESVKSKKEIQGEA